jgi:YggT family protein
MNSLFRLIDMLFWLLDLAILVRVLFSWVNPDPYNSLVRLVYQVTEPILAPLRRIIPPIGGLDLSPMVALVLISLVREILVAVLF